MVRLINKEPVNAELFKGDRIVMWQVMEIFKPRFQYLLLPFQLFDRHSSFIGQISPVRLLDLCCKLVKLLFQDPLLPFG